MNKTFNNAVTRAEKSQKLACDPMTSVWVSASAGTGKTKVLTDRVLSLLVNRADPNKIICLTFTKAAAAEMLGLSRQSLYVKLHKYGLVDTEEG